MKPNIPKNYKYKTAKFKGVRKYGKAFLKSARKVNRNAYDMAEDNIENEYD